MYRQKPSTVAELKEKQPTEQGQCFAAHLLLPQLHNNHLTTEINREK